MFSFISCYISIMGGIQGVGFDLDGTLYANYKLHIRYAPFALRELPLLMALVKARKRLRAGDSGGKKNEGRFPSACRTGFYDEQAALAAEYLREDTVPVREKIERLVYRTQEEQFSRIKPFPHLKETLSAFMDAGLRLGLLSDFPPKRKLELLGLDGFFETALSSEETGALKPNPLSFRCLAEKMGVQPERILYVGNSPAYDAAGAKSAGMKAALIRRGIPSTGFPFGPAVKQADFIFGNYRQLREYVLG